MYVRKPLLELLYLDLQYWHANSKAGTGFLSKGGGSIVAISCYNLLPSYIWFRVASGFVILCPFLSSPLRAHGLLGLLCPFVPSIGAFG